MSKLDGEITEENKLSEKIQKPWKRPELDRLGNLKTFVKATNPGKPDFGIDGEGVGGGEEMDMVG